MPTRSRNPAERVATTIEHAAGLDAVAERIAALTRRVIRPGASRDLLSGKQLGHPAHPGLVVLPMGTLLSATALDLMGGEHGRSAARRLIALGLVTAVPAVATGANDWLDTEQAERRVGLVHWALNAGALSLYARSWLARAGGQHGRGTAFGLLGAAVLGASGWLGGHLAYALGVGVDTTAFTHMTSQWSDVGSVAELEHIDDVLVGDAEGTAILVVRTSRGFAAIADRCTHRGAPLHEGVIGGDCVTCPWHASVFDLTDGAVLSGPATRPQPSFEVRTVDGRVQVRRADEQSALRTNPA